MNENKEESENYFFYLALFIIGSVIYYFIRKASGDYRISKPIFEIIIFLLAFSLGSYAIWTSRYYMPHVTCNGFSGSILGRPVVVKDTQTNTEYLIFNTGEHLQPVYGAGKLATLVISKKGCYRAGRNYVGNHFVSKTPLNFLPPSVFSYLYRNKADFNTDKIFFGKFSEEFVKEHPDVPDYEHIIEKLNSQVNERDKIIEKDNDTLIEMKKAAEEITGTKEAWYKGLLAPKTQPPQQNVQ